MITSLKTTIAITSLLSAAIFALPAIAGNGNSTDPLIPVGSLSAYPTLVQTGTHPTLNWEIQYPETAEDIVTIEPGGTITPKVDLCLEIRVLGASYQIGRDRKGRPIWGYVQAEVKVGNSSTWSRFFNDTQDKVKPHQIYYAQGVARSYPIEFRARCYTGRYWKPYRSTENPSANLVALVDGDTPPTSIPAFSQGNIESFLKPYLDAGGKLNLGPKDVIFLIELGQTDTSASGFDLQDLVLLATFDYCKNNNGHGNNYDGVDVSNPGQDGGGPNGEDDPSGDVDDEMH